MPASLGSLRARLTGAVMMPLLALIFLFGGITCRVIHSQVTNTSDQMLIGSVRMLNVGHDDQDMMRSGGLSLSARFRRGLPFTYYSIYQGGSLVAGEKGLMPPSDDHGQAMASVAAVPAGNLKAPRNQADDSDTGFVRQPAHLRDGIVDGKPVRIATEIRILRNDPRPLIVQVADVLDDQWRYEEAKYLQVISAGFLIAISAVLLFYWAITWGLQPLAILTDQVEAARDEPPLYFRLTLGPKAPAETALFARAFNGLLARTEKAVHSLRQFTTNASHQMRTPLAIVRVHLDVLSRAGADSSQGRAAVADIDAGVASLERLLLQLISLARTDEQSIEPDSSFDLAEIAASVIGDRMPYITDDSLNISYEREFEEPVLAHGHPFMAAEMIGNLLDNAIRYNRPGGSVVVRLSRCDNKARVEIEDDGPGIPLAERDRVWERFYRVANGNGRSGSGLGLSIVRALAERIGADISLSSGAGGRGLCAAVDFLAIERSTKISSGSVARQLPERFSDKIVK